jgi:predicted N-acetyltransferase YhbS
MKTWRNLQMDLHIRLETPADYYAVEELTREAFWAFWEPSRKICDEHLLVQRLRSAPSFVPELDFVAELDGRIVGHIIYSKSKIVDDAGKGHETLTFGPLSVLPEHQSKGIGSALMRHSFEKAKHLGFRAVIIFGHPDYYPRVGFRRAAEFGLTTKDGDVFDPLMVYPLYDGALNGIHGRYYIDPVYDNLTEEDVLEFDKRFQPKEQFVPTPISVLLDHLKPDAQKAMMSIDCPSLEMMTSKSEKEIASLSGITGQSIEIIRSVLLEHGIRWGEKK